MAMMKLESSVRDRIDRLAPKPMYEQLTHELVGQIRTQKLSVGDALPGEHMLCERYGISRTVVRQALADLEARGIVHRVKGKGTFVGDGKTGETFACSLRGLHEEVTSRGKVVRSRVLRLERVQASDDVAMALDVEVGTAVVMLERLRLVDEEPWSVSTTWLPETIGAYLVGADLTNRSLYGLLAEHGAFPASATRSVEARLATAEQVELLELGDTPVVMQLKSVCRDARGAVMEYFVAYHRGDRSRFEFEVASAAPLGSVAEPAPLTYPADTGSYN